ncbi:hypothetical protein, partial [Dermacoccus nishinomiyaensis]|uniref:hypothetical protein n=1 Tax=Dermacoccus nishinomiyaensis TaxID=1274 RepID=UPI001C92C453
GMVEKGMGEGVRWVLVEEGVVRGGEGVNVGMGEGEVRGRGGWSGWKRGMGRWGWKWRKVWGG